jgi:NADH-quinone oxidoreductase subunit N
MVLKTFSLFSEYFLAISLIYTISIGILLFSKAKTNIFIITRLGNCILLLLFLTFYLLINDNLLHVFCCNKAILNDLLAFYSKSFIYMFFIFYILLTLNSLIEQKLGSVEYLIILLFSLLGLLLLCNGFDLLIIYISIELSGLSCYVLASFNTNSRYSVDAGLKYFIVGSISSAFFLLGSSLLYFCSGSINFEPFYYLFTLEPYYRFDWGTDHTFSTYNFFV